jgi:DNA mismatch repair protein MutS
MAAADTPLMQQWREIKSHHPDSLLLFRVGDFYEMFCEDAEEGARLLDLTLTSRNNGGSRAPLAGIPVHALDGYLQKLIRQGRRVAVCEQVGDPIPGNGKGIVRREVVETVTPGTALSDSLLNARRNNFLLAISGDAAPGGVLGAAFADLSTGELSARVIEWEQLADLVGQIEPAELLLPRSWELCAIPLSARVHTYRSDWSFEAASGDEELKRRFGVLGLEGFGFEVSDGALVGACGALVAYLVETQPRVAECLRPPRVLRGGGEMQLDQMTRRNLELVEPLSGQSGGETVLGVLDEALTPMGGRMLRRWLLAPLVDHEAIQARQAAVAELVDDATARNGARAALQDIRDLERLAVKIASGRCNPRDLQALAASLVPIPKLGEALESCDSALLQTHRGGLDPLPELLELVSSALADDVPVSLADGGVIRSGYDSELDGLRDTRDGAVGFIASLQARERERTGIGSLRVGFNKVFGYYLEVTRANVDKVPADYQRKQTLANAERYLTPELKEWEDKVLGAEDRIGDLEARLFDRVRREAAEMVPRLQALTERVAAIDVLAGLAQVAMSRQYVRPMIGTGFDIEIRAGRHPVVETMMPREQFIPNDVMLAGDTRIIILTGPNMAGKSTVLRQVGLICLMAQIGSFVPAREARLGIVDRIFTRVGASDNLVRGHSTFMVEMNETAAILNGATEHSLVLLDEIGRGTSTWDGLSVATAVTEFLHERVGAKTIFATHYHELTKLSDRLSGVANFSVAVKEDGDRIVFLRSLIEGGADRSYGVEVARLAGLPREVVERARILLADLEARGDGMSDGAAVPASTRAEQLPLFEPPPHPALDRLRAIDPNLVTPLEALTLLAELTETART